MTGSVKWFDAKKGFGYITMDDGGKDAFVHHSAIQGSGFSELQPGERVEFEVMQNPRGPVAANVIRID